MSKLAIVTLAAGAALLPAAALAQRGPPPGHSWSQSGQRVVVRHDGGRAMHRGFAHHRLQPGFVVHPFWMGPQFHVSNWRLYGFPPPPRDHRWIRYYDDAYLVDGHGRVREGRHGLDWDQYGERWDMADGIPSYYGSGDFHPSEEDYAAVEAYGPSHGRGWDYSEYEDGHGGYRDGYGEGRDGGHGGYRDRYGERREGGQGYGYPPPPYGGCQPAPPRPCPGYGAGHGYGYGYGYYYGWPAVIVETTVTTGSVVEEVVEEVVTVRQRPRRARARPRRCDCPAAAPAPRRPPPAGERG